MTQVLIKLVDFKQDYIQVYKECFNDLMWRQLYGSANCEFHLESFIKNSVLKEYLTVERLIALDRMNKPILFAHLCSEKETCVLVGGIIPGLINSGQGIYCALFIFDYIFKSKDVSTISVNINPSNSISFKMVKAFGFEKINNYDNTVESQIKLQLKRNRYPNKFAIYLLSKSNYEKR